MKIIIVEEIGFELFPQLNENGALITYDITNMESIREIEEICKDLQNAKFINIDYI